MVNCDNCAYQSFCYAGIKDYCFCYIPVKTTNQPPNNYVSYYTNDNSAK